MKLIEHDDFRQPAGEALPPLGQLTAQRLLVNRRKAVTNLFIKALVRRRNQRSGGV